MLDFYMKKIYNLRKEGDGGDMKLCDFSHEYVLGGYKITGYNGNERDIVIPEGVIAVGDDAFCESDIESVAFPSSLVEIGDGAFYDCASLKKIKFAAGGSLRNIGEYCFGFCESLSEVSLPRGLYFVGMDAFYSCFSLKRAALYAEGVVKAEIFLDCTSLEEITVFGDAVPSAWHSEWKSNSAKTVFRQVPPSVKKPASGTKAAPLTPSAIKEPSAPTAPAVQYDGQTWTSLADVPDYIYCDRRNGEVTAVGIGDMERTELRLPNSIAVIEESAFCMMKRLKSFSASEGLKIIGKRAFSFCDSLSEINISENTVVLEEAFFGTAVRSVKLTRNMHNGCFSSCKFLTNADIMPDVTVIPREMFWNTGISEIVLPPAVEAVLDEAFALSALKSITLGENVKLLGRGAFRDCTYLESFTSFGALNKIPEECCKSCTALSSVDLGGAKIIGAYAFAFCTSLRKITIPKSVIKIADSAFATTLISEIKIEGRGHEELLSVLGEGWLTTLAAGREVRLVFDDGTFATVGL